MKEGSNKKLAIAIASGKGGTGKTTVAVNLALASDLGDVYADCDVEGPNAHLFLHPEIRERQAVTISIPVVDKHLCDGCGECSRICRYHAIACVKKHVLVFSELCHGCGGCHYICPKGALSEGAHTVGYIESGRAHRMHFVQGALSVGAVLSPLIIRSVKKKAASHAGNVILDAPPGVSCPVVATVRDCDFIVLVTEPTAFGLYDLMRAVTQIRPFGIPFGVVVNRMGIGDDRVHTFCQQENIPLLAEIPDDRKIAESYSRGGIIIDDHPEYKPLFQALRKAIHQELEKQGGMAS